jgi:hypothetical protein
VAADDLCDGVRVGEIALDSLDLGSARAELLRSRLQRVGLAGADGQRVALVGKGLGERETDTTAGSGDDGGTIRHAGDLSRQVTARNLLCGAWRPSGGGHGVRERGGEAV